MPAPGPAGAGWVAAAARILHDWFTGPDGVTWAIGRAYSAMLFACALALPWAVFGFVVWASTHGKMSPPGIGDWGVFMGAVGAYYGLVGGAVMALVWGTNPTEPKT